MRSIGHESQSKILNATSLWANSEVPYVSKLLLERLWQRGLHLVTSIRRNMKNDLIPMLDKGLVPKRFIIETLFDNLKSSMGLAHTRHRSPSNPLLHILSSLAAYTLA